MGKDSFSYVFIPCDVSEPIQQLEMHIPNKEKEVECLLDKLKAHFKRVGGTKTDQQRQRQRDDLMKKLPADKQSAGANQLEAMLNVATDMTMAESVGLLNHSPDTGFVGVNMYVDDSGAIKELPTNMRASELAACCGNPVQVHGDAFLARVRDDGDEFERLDFQLSEVSSSAPWVQAAKAQAARRQQTESADRVMERMQRQAAARGQQGGGGGSQGAGQQQQGGGSSSATAQIHELSPAEQSKEEGNAAFKRGDNEEAVSHYSRALELDPSLWSARNNRAMACIKLERWAEAEDDCTNVLSQQADNVKALLRRAAARQHLGRTVEAETDLRKVMELQPRNREAGEKLEQLQQAAAAWSSSQA